MDYFSSQCGYVSRSGRECGTRALEGSPVNLCMDHLMEAHRFARDSVVPVDPPKKMDPAFRCARCGRLVARSPLDEPGILHCGNCDVNGKPTMFIRNERRKTLGKETPEFLEEKKPVIYYIQHGDRIKIGASTNWRSRLKAHPHDRVLALEPGWLKQEARRHKQFAENRYGITEWFQPHDALWDHIIDLNDKHPEYREDIDEYNRSLRVELKGKGRREVA